MNPRERIAQLTAEAEMKLRPASLDRLDDTMLPPVYATPRQEISVAPDEAMDTKDHLTRVVTKAIQFLDEMLDMDGSALTAEEARGFSLQLQAAQTAINTQTKVDDTQLRRRQVDMIPKLLELISREEARLPATPVLELEAQ